MKNKSLACLIFMLVALACTSGASQQQNQSATQAKPSETGSSWLEGVPPVTAPPEAFFNRYGKKDVDVARKFYKKYIDVKGMPVVGRGEVADEALQRTYYIVTHMLAGRPDILEAMAKNGTRLIIIGKDQVYTDMPEYRNHPNPAYQNERVRGTGGFGVTSFGEENLLNLPIDRYDDESIAVHEFCHTIDAALSRDRSGWQQAPEPDLSKRQESRVCGSTPTPAPIRASTGPRFASPTSTATASTTGTTTRSPRASN